MTGFRVGNPKRVRKRRECLSCHEERFIKARNLCETCHKYATAAGTIEQFPKLSGNPDVQAARGYCGCYSPIRVHLTLWNADECLKCGKPLP